MVENRNASSPATKHNVFMAKHDTTMIRSSFGLAVPSRAFCVAIQLTRNHKARQRVSRQACSCTGPHSVLGDGFLHQRDGLFRAPAGDGFEHAVACFIIRNEKMFDFVEEWCADLVQFSQFPVAARLDGDAD
jgi:hypothetical protein